MDQSFDVALALPFEEAVERVTEALRDEGFGILTRADIHQAFREKLGKAFRPYVILGACNPALAFRALGARPEVGLFLPCNVTVEEAPDGTSLVRLLDPDAIMAQEQFSSSEDLVAVAAEARKKIGRVAAALRAETADTGAD